MGYSLVVTFKSNDKKVFECLGDWLKCLQSERYSARFDNIDFESAIEDGYIYTRQAFADALATAEKNSCESIAKKAVLENLKDSIEYYKLNDEQKESLLSDLSYYEDVVDDFKYQVCALRKIIALYDVLSEDYYYDGDGVEENERFGFDNLTLEITVC